MLRETCSENLLGETCSNNLFRELTQRSLLRETCSENLLKDLARKTCPENLPLGIECDQIWSEKAVRVRRESVSRNQKGVPSRTLEDEAIFRSKVDYLLIFVLLFIVWCIYSCLICTSIQSYQAFAATQYGPVLVGSNLFQSNIMTAASFKSGAWFGDWRGDELNHRSSFWTRVFKSPWPRYLWIRAVGSTVTKRTLAMKPIQPTLQLFTFPVLISMELAPRIMDGVAGQARAGNVEQAVFFTVNGVTQSNCRTRARAGAFGCTCFVAGWNQT